MAEPLPKTDVVIIGLGAAGGIASYVLTNAGLNVVGLEAGPRLDNEDFMTTLDEISGGSMTNVLGAPKWNREVPTWRTDEATPATQAYAASGMVNAVGGTSIHYSAQSWRFRDDDFAIRSSTVEKYGEEAIPAGSTLVDWPLTYDELEPYYDQVERLIGVSGDAGANPFESPRSNAFPMPPLRADGYGALLADTMTQLDYHPFPIPAAVASEEYNGRPACSYCGFCSGFGCWNNSKSSTLVSAIAAAEETGSFEIRPDSRVTRIVTNDAGKATGVEYVDANGEAQFQPAGVVILSSYVFENNRLLFLSASDRHPDGIGNANGQLGKHFMAHLYVIAYGFLPGIEVNKGGGLVAQGRAMDDFNGDNFDHTGLEFIRGGLMFPIGGTETLPIGNSRNLPPGTPQWGSAYKAWLHENANSVAGVMAQCEFLPYEANYLDLDPEVTDPSGMPVIRITHDTHENEIKQGEYMVGKLTEMLETMGATATWSYPFASSSPVNTHAYGGTRMGDDPATSVVNKYSLVHDAPNLAVLGGSTFCGTSGYNPTETIQALAWLAAENIATNFDTIAG